MDLKFTSATAIFGEGFLLLYDLNKMINISTKNPIQLTLNGIFN